MRGAGAIWTVIVLVGLGSFAVRVLFLLPRTSARPAPTLGVVLRMIPPAAFAALVVPALLRPHGTLDLLTPGLFAGLLAAAVAWWSRSIAATIAVGLVAAVVLQQVPGLS